MSDDRHELCRNCKGKGHVLDATPVIFLPVIGWLAAILETNSRGGLTRQRCITCKGKGWINLTPTAKEGERGE
jgi:DnaJ-class molecular chaperone